MKSYYISGPTRQLFQLHVRPGYELRDTAEPTRRPNLYRLTLSDDVAERLESKRLPSESDDDLLTRILSTTKGLN